MAKSVTGLTCTMFFIYTATSTALAKYFAGDVIINLINCMLGENQDGCQLM